MAKYLNKSKVDQFVGYLNKYLFKDKVDQLLGNIYIDLLMFKGMAFMDQDKLDFHLKDMTQGSSLGPSLVHHNSDQ
eukprot:9499191-Prorocentrum_lima.AAC.1